MKVIPVFYSDEMCADSESFSPSAAKPGKVVKSWKKLHVPMEIIAPLPATKSMLYLAHSPGFVHDVLDCKVSNGFGNLSPAVAASLPYTTGSMCAAVDEAVTNGIGAVSPTSGFHHAGYDFCGGYCTFNGLMVAARCHAVLNVGILDMDQHRGNGTEDIINYLRLKNITHYTYGAHKKLPGAAFIKSLPKILKRFAGCDVLLYQAGADSHFLDPLGGCLTTAELFARDSLVFSTMREMGIPVAWNLAGGYNHDFKIVLDIHNNTMSAFADSFFRA